MGEIYALSCAIIWAFAVILLKRSGERIEPFALNLFRVGFSVPLIVATLLVARVPFVPESVTGRDFLILLISGIMGVAIADTLFHKSLNLIGAGITAIIDTLYSPMIVLLAYLFLGERLEARHVLGMGLIVVAVLLSATLKPPPQRTRGELIKGLLIGAAGLAFLASSIVLVKPVLGRTPVLWAVAVRQIGSLVVLGIAAAGSARRRTIFATLRPSAAWRHMVPATFLGSYLALILWIAGTKYTLASIAAILNQSSTVFILIFAVIFLRERMTARRAFSALLAIAGVLLVTLG